MNEELRVKSEELLEKYLAGKAPLHANRLKLPTEEELDEAEAAFESLTPRPLQGERELKHRRLWPWVGAIAASIVVAFILWPNSPAVIKQQPPVAEVVEQPVPETPEASDYSEPTNPTKPHRTHKPHHSIPPQEEPLLAETEAPAVDDIDIAAELADLKNEINELEYLYLSCNN